MSILANQTAKVNQDFLRKLIGFYRPTTFTNKSTQFDMGYEQAKRDLRKIVLSEIPDASEYENFDVAEHTQEPLAWYSKWFK